MTNSDEETFLTRNVQQTEVCGACGELSGPVVTFSGEARVQACACMRADGSVRDEPLWPRFDFNTAIELCSGCAGSLVRSGSRWSCFFCRPCITLVERRNEHAPMRLQIPGYIPIGRHPRMHGIEYVRRRSDMAPDEPELLPPPSYIESAADLELRVERLRHWHFERVRVIVRSFGRDRVPTASYLERAAELYTPADAIVALDAHLDELGPPPHRVRPDRYSEALARRG
jgi:hypothetical protein